MPLKACTRRLQDSLRLIGAPNLDALDVSRNQQLGTMMLQRFFFGRRTPFRDLLAHNELVRALHDRLCSVPRHLRSESSNLLKVWAHQCECVVAQRVRRSQQMFALYTRIWEEQALRRFAAAIRQHLARRGRDLLLGAAGVSMFNWDAQRISEEEMRKHLEEMEYIQLLKQKTINCSSCNNPDKSNLDKAIIAFCECDTRKDVRTYDNWSVFIEQQDLIVWRRPHKSGSYEYKVYGSYNDVTAEDFLSVQIDTAYRKQWDPTAMALEVIERDQSQGTNSDVVYWEMQWPRLFANRDYVFKRRFLVDRIKKMVMLLSKGTEHPRYPTTNNKFRVSDYWSSMVIKPYSEIDKPGIEFSLTYFDNPGVNIPASVTAWVAYRAMPDFLTRLRAATIKYKQYCREHKCRSIYSYQDDADGVKKTSTHDADLGDELPLPRVDRVLDESFFTMLNNELEEEGAEAEHLQNNMERDKDADEITSPAADASSDGSAPAKSEQDVIVVCTTSEDGMAGAAEVYLTPSPIMQNDQSYWKYLQPTYYIS